MKFYTSVHRKGNYILHRGYENGQRIIEKDLFRPTLFVETKDSYRLENSWTTIDDRKVSPKIFDDMKSAGDFVRQFEDTNMRIEGNTNYVAQFLCDRYPGVVDFDPSLINVGIIDIEVASGTQKYSDSHEIKVRRKT